jgi:hypothetical protein
VRDGVRESWRWKWKKCTRSAAQHGAHYLDGSQSICPAHDRPGLLSVKKTVRWLERSGALGMNFTL